MIVTETADKIKSMEIRGAGRDAPGCPQKHFVTMPSLSVMFFWQYWYREWNGQPLR